MAERHQGDRRVKRTLFVVGVLLCAMPALAFAQAADLSAADRGAIRTVIEDQLAASCAG